MTHTDVTTPEITDPELISRVREGDVAAYGTLFSRHVDAATRLARLLVNGSDADDLVSEAFVKVLNVLLGGGGPDVAFRAYLLTAVRRLHIDKVRGAQRLTTTDDLTPFDPGVPFSDTAVAGFEGGAAAKAFASLPERWQMVLWHLEVENQKPADIAPLLGMSANSVSALAYRAREGLRQAFLNMHSGDLVSDACRDTNDLLGGYVRGALSRRDTTAVEEHLERCRRCTAVYLELREVNSSLAALLGPALLGAAGAAYLSGGSAAASGFGTGVLALLGRGRDVVVGNAAASVATAAVVGVAGITAIAAVNRGPAEPPASAEQSVPGTVTPSVGPSTTPAAPGRPGRSAGVDPQVGVAILPGSTVLPTVTPLAAATASPSEQQQAGLQNGAQSGQIGFQAGASAPDDPSGGDDPRPGTSNPGNGPRPGGPGKPKPNPKPQPNPQPNPAPKPNPQPNPTPNPNPKPNPQPNPTPNPNPQPEPKPPKATKPDKPSTPAEPTRAPDRGHGDGQGHGNGKGQGHGNGKGHSQGKGDANRGDDDRDRGKGAGEHGQSGQSGHGGGKHGGGRR